VNIEIVCAGHTPKPHEARWVDDYLRRAQKFANVRITRVRERASDTPGQTVAKTWGELQRKIPKESYRVVLDPRGKTVTTEGLGALVAAAERSGKKSISFVIGGSYGLPKEAADSANAVVSLTPLTLPHRIALLVLSEQIYRALSRKAGAPYHHE
jgi:23S rRNA (pseudouridine1915-N3)-methyltransferase